MPKNPQDTPKPPRGLTRSTRQWFVDTCARWELEQHHVRLLSIAARAWDEAESASSLIRRDGLLITMPSGFRRPHPAARLANESRAMFARALRELDLDLEREVDLHWLAIIRVADALQKERTLTGDQVHAIVEDAEGTP